jgi:uncharacterized protein (TIGR03067 family)
MNRTALLVAGVLGLSVVAAFVWLTEFDGREESPEQVPGDPLAGSWTCVRFESNGHEETWARNTPFQFKDGRMTNGDPVSKTTQRDKVGNWGLYTLDTSVNPASIDLTDGDQTGTRTMRGIFSVNERKALICLPSTTGEARPTDFVSREGEFHTLITLRRN